MYAPSAFVETDAAQLRALVRQHAFALLTTTEADGSRATHSRSQR